MRVLRIYLETGSGEAGCPHLKEITEFCRLKNFCRALFDVDEDVVLSVKSANAVTAVRATQVLRVMAKTAQFPSLDRLQSALCTRSKLLDTFVDEELLSSLQPTPYDAFQRALDNEGAKEPDIQAFLHSLKALKVGR